MVTINVQISARTHTTWKLYLLIVTDFISNLKDTGNCVAEESIFLLEFFLLECLASSIHLSSIFSHFRTKHTGLFRAVHADI